MKKVIDIDPNYTDAYSYLGNVYEDQGNPIKAREYYGKIPRVDPDGSIESMKKIIELNPSDFNAHINLGIAYDEKGN